MTDNLLDTNNIDNSLDDLRDDVDYLTEIAGEGKKFDKSKYASQEEWEKAIARGKYLADSMLETVKRRSDELRADYLKLKEEADTRASLAEMLDQLKQQQLASNEHLDVKEDDKPKFDPQQLDELISTKMQEKARIEKEENNYKTVMAKLTERLGTNYPSVLKERADALGLSGEDVTRMAKINPNLFYKTFDLDESNTGDSFQTPPRSNVRSSFAPKGKEKRTLSYYQKLREREPRLYFDPKIAIQMDKDAQELGREFFDI